MNLIWKTSTVIASLWHNLEPDLHSSHWLAKQESTFFIRPSNRRRHFTQFSIQNDWLKPNWSQYFEQLKATQIGRNTLEFALVLFLFFISRGIPAMLIFGLWVLMPIFSQQSSILTSFWKYWLLPQNSNCSKVWLSFTSNIFTHWAVWTILYIFKYKNT